MFALQVLGRPSRALGGLLSFRIIDHKSKADRESGLKILHAAEPRSAVYCLPDGTLLEVSCVELIGEEVFHHQDIRLLEQALMLYAQARNADKSQ